MSVHLHLTPETSNAAKHRTPASIRVVLADDHAMMRRTLRLLLESEADVEVIAEASDLRTVMHHVRAHHPEVLVLDFGMPTGSSIEAIRRLRSQAPSTEIVVLTMQESPAFAQHALDAGAIAFVLKDVADTDLPEAVRLGARGEHYVSPRVAANLNAFRHSSAASGLSAREAEVVRLIARGYTTAEIAQELHISKRTVDTHREHVHDKLGLRTRRELVGYALGQGLLAP
jgi:DNA-binding NarL/FixJ family response regulator